MTTQAAAGGNLFCASSTSPPTDRREAVREAAGTLYHRRIRHLIRRRGLDRDAAHEIVAEATLKALATKALPEIPTFAWFKAIDANALKDVWRTQARRRAAHAAMVEGQKMHEESYLPAKPKAVLDGDSDAEVEFHQTERVQAGSARYKPVPPPVAMTSTPAEVFQEATRVSDRVSQATGAARTLTDLAHRAGVTDADLALAQLRYGGLTPLAWSAVAKSAGMRRETAKAKVEAAVRALEATAPGSDVVVLFQRVALGTAAESAQSSTSTEGIQLADIGSAP
jgi:DNA-directed RNA polymerase specialized sigma24 family protein